MDLLSVVVPVYNSEKYMEKCIESILAQTYSELEIILVDDGSSDRSGLICKSYMEKYRNVVYIHQAHAGITKARLAGVRQASGRRITFVDSDDWIDEDFYERLCGDGADCDLIISGIYRYYGADKCLKETYLDSGIFDKERILEEVVPRMMWDFSKNTWALDPSLCTKIFRRDKLLYELEKTEKVASLYGEDSMVVFPMMFRVEKMKVVKEAFYYHRQRKKGEYPYYIKDDLFLERLHQVYMYLKNEFYQVGYLNVMNRQLEYFYFKSVKMKERSYGFPWYWPYPVFPFYAVERDSKVILYGAGKFGINFKEQNEEYNFCNIICWVDRNYKAFDPDTSQIASPDIIKELDFDHIVIAIENYHIASAIKIDLIQMQVPEEKIVWHGIRRCIEEQT